MLATKRVMLPDCAMLMRSTCRPTVRTKQDEMSGTSVLDRDMNGCSSTCLPLVLVLLDDLQHG